MATYEIESISDESAEDSAMLPHQAATAVEAMGDSPSIQKIVVMDATEGGSDAEDGDRIPAVHSLAGAALAFLLYAVAFMVHRAVIRAEWQCSDPTLRTKFPPETISLLYTLPQIVVVPFINVSLVLNRGTPGFDSATAAPRPFREVIKHRDFIVCAITFGLCMLTTSMTLKLVLTFLPSIVHGILYMVVLSLLNFAYVVRRRLLWHGLPTLLVTLIIPMYGGLILVVSALMALSPTATGIVLVLWPVILAVMEFAIIRLQGHFAMASGIYSSREMYMCSLFVVVANETLRIAGVIALTNPGLQSATLSLNVVMEVLSRNNVTLHGLALATGMLARCPSAFRLTDKVDQYRGVYLGARVFGDLIPAVYLFYVCTVFWFFPYKFDLVDCLHTPNENVRATWTTFVLIVAFSLLADVLAKGLERWRVRSNPETFRVDLVYAMEIPCALLCTLAAAIFTFQGLIGAAAVFDAAEAAGYTSAAPVLV